MVDKKATAATRARYNRIAPVYDLMEILAERLYACWRPQLWSLVEGTAVLEVGVGTGKNIEYYPAGVQLTAIDLSPGMLARAQMQAKRSRQAIDLQIGDVQALTFAANSFDQAVATFVFCSVPDPHQGLMELARVVKPGGQIVLLEHVRSKQAILGQLMDILNPIIVRLIGANINRLTVENVRRSGLEIERVVELGRGDIFKLIVARVPQ